MYQILVIQETVSRNSFAIANMENLTKKYNNIFYVNGINSFH